MYKEEHLFEQDLKKESGVDYHFILLLSTSDVLKKCFLKRISSIKGDKNKGCSKDSLAPCSLFRKYTNKSWNGTYMSPGFFVVEKIPV